MLLRQGSSPQGQNAEGGLSAADEPGPKGDAQIFFSVKIRLTSSTNLLDLQAATRKRSEQLRFGPGQV